jgi:hypothetical protein
MMDLAQIFCGNVLILTLALTLLTACNDNNNSLTTNSDFGYDQTTDLQERVNASNSDFGYDCDTGLQETINACFMEEELNYSKSFIDSCNNTHQKVIALHGSDLASDNLNQFWQCLIGFCKSNNGIINDWDNIGCMNNLAIDTDYGF